MQFQLALRRWLPVWTPKSKFKAPCDVSLPTMSNPEMMCVRKINHCFHFRRRFPYKIKLEGRSQFKAA